VSIFALQPFDRQNSGLLQAILAPLPQMRPDPPPPPPPAPPVEWPLVWKEAQRLVSNLKWSFVPPQQQELPMGGADAEAASNSSSHSQPQEDAAAGRSLGQGAEPDPDAKVCF